MLNRIELWGIGKQAQYRILFRTLNEWGGFSVRQSTIIEATNHHLAAQLFIDFQLQKMLYSDYFIAILVREIKRLF